MGWNDPDFSVKMDWTPRTIFPDEVLTLPEPQRHDREVTLTALSEDFSFLNGYMPSAPPDQPEQESDSQDLPLIPLTDVMGNVIWTEPEPAGGNDVIAVPHRPVSGVYRRLCCLEYVTFFCATSPFFFGLLLFFFAVRYKDTWFSILPLLLMCGLVIFYWYFFKRSSPELAEEQAREGFEAMEDHPV